MKKRRKQRHKAQAGSVRSADPGTARLLEIGAPGPALVRVTGLPVGLSKATRRTGSPTRPDALAPDERLALTALLLPFFIVAFALAFSHAVKVPLRLLDLAESGLPLELPSLPPSLASVATPTLSLPTAAPEGLRARVQVAMPQSILAPGSTTLAPIEKAPDEGTARQQQALLPSQVVIPEPVPAIPTAVPPAAFALPATPPEFAVAAPVEPPVCLPKPPATRVEVVHGDFGSQLAKAAMAQTSQFVVYSAAYKRIAYPMGDIPSLYGACSDVIIRAYRSLGTDLQELVQKTRVGRGDTSIDHRRTETLRSLFTKLGASMPVTSFPEDYKPGDVVTYYRPFSRVSKAHIAIVSDVIGPSGRPMIVHNRGWGPQLEDALFVDQITGHYRYAGAASRITAVPSNTAGTPESKRASIGLESLKTGAQRLRSKSVGVATRMQ